MLSNIYFSHNAFALCLEKLMVLLRDGRTLIGVLRSVDQFANIVLQDTIERIHVNKEYGDIPRGIFIVRGENVVLLGEIVSILQEKRTIPDNKKLQCDIYMCFIYAPMIYDTTLKQAFTFVVGFRKGKEFGIKASVGRCHLGCSKTRTRIKAK